MTHPWIWPRVCIERLVLYLLYDMTPSLRQFLILLVIENHEIHDISVAMSDEPWAWMGTYDRSGPS